MTPDSPYQRTVSYRLSPGPGGTRLTCTQVTTIPGLNPRLLPRASRTETKSMFRSLARLRTCVDLGRVGLWQKFADSSQTPQPL
jgi:hypothetical protein